METQKTLTQPSKGPLCSVGKVLAGHVLDISDCNWDHLLWKY